MELQTFLTRYVRTLIWKEDAIPLREKEKKKKHLIYDDVYLFSVIIHKE